MNCCCRYGAAVGGELPEFICPDCERHNEWVCGTDVRCRRHRRIVAFYEDYFEHRGDNW